MSASDNLSIANPNAASRLIHRLSMKRSQNNYVANNKNANNKMLNNLTGDDVNEPLLTKDEKRIKAAVKMVKGKSNLIDIYFPLLQYYLK